MSNPKVLVCSTTTQRGSDAVATPKECSECNTGCPILTGVREQISFQTSRFKAQMSKKEVSTQMSPDSFLTQEQEGLL